MCKPIEKTEIQIETDRLRLTPMTLPEMDALIAQTRPTDPELSQAYREMRDGCVAHPAQYAWYAAWRICLRTNSVMVGDACFKGLPENGRPEIGYGILAEYEERGFATEAVGALCRWAVDQPGVAAVEAETAPANAASQRVLAKLGFCPTGKTGEEGPRFIWIPKIRA